MSGAEGGPQTAGGEQGNQEVVWYEKIHSCVVKSFSAYGTFSAKHFYIPFILGMIFCIVFSTGITQSELETDLERLWMEEGTRVIDEYDFYKEHWGGLQRKTGVLVRHSSGSVLNKESLDALKDALGSIADKNETNSENSDYLILESNGYDFQMDDFCERPYVPSTYGDGGTLSRTYVTLNQCVNSRYFGGVAAELPTGWYIDRFPCTRITALDCFMEGKFDYPYSMSQLEDECTNGCGVPYGPAIYTYYAKSGLLTGGSGHYDRCLNETVIDAVAYSVSVSTGYNFSYSKKLVISGAAAAEDRAYLNYVLDLTVDAFFSYGYHWRLSYSNMTDAEIGQHIYDALQNSASEVSLSSCILGNLPCCMSWRGFHWSNSVMMGGKENDGSTMTKLEAFMTVVNQLDSDNFQFQDAINAKTGGAVSDYEVLQLDWEQLQKDKLEAKYDREANSNWALGETHDNNYLVFTVARDIEDLLDEASAVDSTLVTVGYAVLLAYAMFSFGQFGCGNSCRKMNNFIYGRTVLALFGVVIVALASVAGFGCTAYFGIKYTGISLNLVPFLALGLGIDDMFVMAHANAHETHLQFNPIKRTAQAIASAGPSVSFTTLANFAAFMIASATPIPAVKSFCWQMGITMFFNWFMLLTMFVPLLVLDNRRVANQKSEFCCIGPKDGEKLTEKQFSHNGVSVIDRCVTRHYAPTLLKTPVRICVVVAFLAFFIGMAVNGFTEVEGGLALSDVALKGTPLRDFLEAQEASFDGRDSYLITRTNPYHEDACQQAMLDQQDYLQQSKWVTDDTTIRVASWYADDSSSSLLKGTTPLNLTKTAFYAEFQSFMSTTGASKSLDLVCYDPSTGAHADCAVSGNEIQASRQTVLLQGLSSHDNIIDSVVELRDRADYYAVDGNDSYLIGTSFTFYEQYLHIFENMYKIVGFALLGVFVSSLLFQFSLGTSFILAILILMIDIEVYGMLPLIDVKLNAFSVVNLCITIGMSVEYTAHLAHAFLIAQGTRHERVVAALNEMCAPMLHGAVTSFLAIISLAFAKFPFFRAYYFGMFALSILISCLNGLVLLPVILSWIGPSSKPFLAPKRVRGSFIDRRLSHQLVVLDKESESDDGDNGLVGDKKAKVPEGNNDVHPVKVKSAHDNGDHGKSIGNDTGNSTGTATANANGNGNALGNAEASSSSSSSSSSASASARGSSDGNNSDDELIALVPLGNHKVPRNLASVVPQ